jgi:hypothetical protein
VKFESVTALVLKSEFLPHVPSCRSVRSSDVSTDRSAFIFNVKQSKISMMKKVRSFETSIAIHTPKPHNPEDLHLQNVPSLKIALYTFLRKCVCKQDTCF